MSVDLKKIKKIASKVQKSLFREANAISSGLFKTQFRGSGLQFREHQIYEPGDDVRFIDWKLSAKMRKTYVKTFEEERNVEVDVLIDLTPSMMLGFQETSKLQAAMEIAAMLGMIAQKTGDKIKVILLSSQVLESKKSVGGEFITALVSLMQKMNLFTEQGNINRDLEIQSAPQEERIKVIKRLLASKKQVLFISDFSEIADDALKTAWGRKNFHPIQLVIPLDYAVKVPYSLCTKYDEKVRFTFRKSVQKDEKFTLVKDKILKLDVSKNYLNDFINLMRRKV
jgi:uncharacterized protein (DUF58 family)